jgi:hypothetical protein
LEERIKDDQNLSCACSFSGFPHDLQRRKQGEPGGSNTAAPQTPTKFTYRPIEDKSEGFDSGAYRPTVARGRKSDFSI